jgi:hypothetical protein
VLRVLDSLQLTAGHSVAMLADWKQGDDVIIVNSISDDDARTRPYLRVTPQPDTGATRTAAS